MLRPCRGSREVQQEAGEVEDYTRHPGPKQGAREENRQHRGQSQVSQPVANAGILQEHATHRDTHDRSNLPRELLFLW